MTISDQTLKYWAWREEVKGRIEKRTRFTQDDGAMPMTQGWSRYRPNERPVMVTDAWGKSRWITPKQYQVLQASKVLQAQASMATIAASLGVATSTVSRALLRLASMGLVAFDVKRGRNGGVTFIKALGAELEKRAQGAWERLKQYRLRAEERVWNRAYATGYPVNVATITRRDATISSWTPSELAAMGL